MPDTNKGNELSQEDTILHLSTGENIGLLLSWLWPIVFVIVILINFPSYESSAGIVYLLGGGVIAFCLYKAFRSIQTIESGKIFMKLTSDSVYYQDQARKFDIPWANISEFLVENNEVRDRNGTRRVELLYVITKDNKDKHEIVYYFGYDNLGLAVLMSRKMGQSLNLPSDQDLVRVVDLRFGKPIPSFEPDEGWTPKRPPFI